MLGGKPCQHGLTGHNGRDPDLILMPEYGSVSFNWGRVFPDSDGFLMDFGSVARVNADVFF